MGALLSRDDWGVANKGVVDTGVGYKVGLEFIQINIESTVKSQRGSDRADDLCNKTVEMLVIRPRDIQAATADIVDRLVVNEECAVRVLNGAVGREDSIVWLNDGGRDARSRVDGEFELALLAIVGREALEEESTETRTCTSTEGVEDEETLKRGAVIWPSLIRAVVGCKRDLRTGDATNLVNHAVDHLLANGVVTTSICRCQLCSMAERPRDTHSCWQHPPCR